jgi:hypothetical protein
MWLRFLSIYKYNVFFVNTYIILYKCTVHNCYNCSHIFSEQGWTCHTGKTLAYPEMPFRLKMWESRQYGLPKILYALIMPVRENTTKGPFLEQQHCLDILKFKDQWWSMDQFFNRVSGHREVTPLLAKCITSFLFPSSWQRNGRWPLQLCPYWPMFIVVCGCSNAVYPCLLHLLRMSLELALALGRVWLAPVLPTLRTSHTKRTK